MGSVMKSAIFQGNSFLNTTRLTTVSALLLIAGLVAASLTGCSFDASVTDYAPSTDVPNVSLSRAAPDFLSGEVVTTTNGTTIRAVFGEVTEKRVLSSGHTVEGVAH